MCTAIFLRAEMVAILDPFYRKSHLDLKIRDAMWNDILGQINIGTFDDELLKCKENILSSTCVVICAQKLETGKSSLEKQKEKQKTRQEKAEKALEKKNMDTIGKIKVKQQTTAEMKKEDEANKIREIAELREQAMDVLPFIFKSPSEIIKNKLQADVIFEMDCKVFLDNKSLLIDLKRILHPKGKFLLPFLCII
jgi:hypothetical protein